MTAHLIADEGPLRGLVLNFEEGEDWILGRDPDEADYVIEDTTVSRKHARVTKTAEGLFIRNLSRVNPTLVNDKEIDERHLLQEGDRIKIGHTVFLFSGTEAPQAAQVAPPNGKKKKKAKGGYDNIFGDLEGELPPEPEPVEMVSASTPPEKEEEPAPEEVAEKTAYDTIFEDLGGESEMPFQLMPETPLVLKVIGGPNAGAEIGLEKGRTYVIGKDSGSSDIVFQDLSVSRHHAKLSVSADGIIELEDLGSKNGTLVNGVALTEKKTVTTQDLIAMGTTVFLIIDREAAQETIYSPMMPIYEAQKPQEEAAAGEQPSVEEDWKRQPIPMKLLVGGGAVLVILFVACLGFFSLFKSKSTEMAFKSPVDKIQEIVAKYPAVKFSYNPASGRLFLTGHVLTGIDYQELNYNLDQLAAISGKEDTVVIDELVWRSMNDVISDNANWRAVNIMTPQAGQFVAQGYVQSGDIAAQLSEYLTVNFPYLDRLTNDVVVEDTLEAQILSLLQSNGFGVVTFQMINGDLLLGGRYPEKKEEAYRSLVKEIRKLSGVRNVKDVAIAVNGLNASIDLSQQYAVTGSATQDRHGYSVIVNGRIYSIGQSLDGMEITSIEPNSILLEKEGLKYKINYTR